MQCISMSAPSSTSSPLRSFLSCLLLEHNCSSFGEAVVDNPRPNWHDRQHFKIHHVAAVGRSINHNDGPLLNDSSSHSATRWKSNETTTVASDPSSPTATKNGLIPVVRKASPIINQNPTVFNSFPVCPVRKLSQETHRNDDRGGTMSWHPMRNISLFHETEEVGMRTESSDRDNGNKGFDLSSPKSLTLSEALQLPVYSPSVEQFKKLKKSTDSTVSCVSSAGRGSKPPLSPKKRAEIKSFTSCGGSRNTIKSNTKTVTKPTIGTTKNNSTSQTSPIYQAQSLHTHFLHQLKIPVPAMEKSPSSSDSSPRSIADYATAMIARPTVDRRSLSKTLGVDFQETAPIQPMRRPSSEPDQHHIVAPRRGTSSFLPSKARTLMQRQGSTLSASSSGSASSSIFSDGSQSSGSNSISIATFPSFCSAVTTTSDTTVKARNGFSRNVIAGDDGTQSIMTADRSHGHKVTFARPLAFLPTPLEQVSEHSISDCSESTACSSSPTVSSAKRRIQRRGSEHGEKGKEGLLEEDTECIEVGLHPKATIVDDALVASVQREIVFEPPASPDSLPVDHESIVDRFEDGSPTSTEVGKSKTTVPGRRFMRLLKNKFR